MSTLEQHALTELRAAGFFDEDSDYSGMLGDAVMELIRVFADQGHTGMSAPMALGIFDRLAQFEPLGPLTGEDDEWVDVSEHMGQKMWQNKRCGRVFKHEDGTAYDVEGKVFREPDGTCFIGTGSATPVEFPYTPKREYVDVLAKDVS